MSFLVFVLVVNKYIFNERNERMVMLQEKLLYFLLTLLAIAEIITISPLVTLGDLFQGIYKVYQNSNFKKLFERGDSYNQPPERSEKVYSPYKDGHFASPAVDKEHQPVQASESRETEMFSIAGFSPQEPQFEPSADAKEEASAPGVVFGFVS